MDTQLVTSLLKSSSLSLELDRVDSMSAFRSALDSGAHSLVLSDYTVPGLDPLEALAYVREHVPHVPFLFLSGTIGEETAVEALKRGATDYVFKQRIGRLVPSIERALAEAEQQQRRREAERALRQSEERFRTMADAIPQLAWVADSDGHQIWFNHRWYEYTGTTPEEVNGSGWQRVHDSQVLPAVMERWRRSLDTGQPFEMEIPLRGSDQQYRRFLTRVVPMRDPDGRVTQWFGTHTDVTDLLEADRRKTEFLAMLSHELRNPLAPIRNGLFILDRAPPGSDLARRAQAVMERQVNHLTRLVDDLLDITRISRGKIQLRREAMDLAEVVRRSAEDHRSAYDVAGVELHLQVPRFPILMYGDQTRIAQVIGNLLQNASKFTPSGGTVTISVEKDTAQQLAIVHVRDTGAGIAPEMIPRLFEPFTQGDTTLDRSKGGLGLGLALVRGLVDMHGGRVEVESHGIGSGAHFTIRLPLTGDSAETTAEEAGGQRRLGPRRVLVIEDNMDAANSLRDVLEIQGHSVEVALSGAEGIGKARDLGPEVVLCDIGLPQMSGYEVAQALRADGALRGIKLVALSGYAAPDDVAKAKEAGFDMHLAKPPTMEQLEHALQDVGSHDHPFWRESSMGPAPPPG